MLAHCTTCIGTMITHQGEQATCVGICSLTFDVVARRFPGEDAAVHIVHVVEPLLPQVVGDLPAAVAAPAGHNHRLVGRYIVQALGDFGHGNQRHAGDVSLVVFPLLAHVEHQHVV